MKLRRYSALALALTVFAAACSSDDSSTATPADSSDSSTTESASGGVADTDVVAGEVFADERCAANEAAGTITYLTGFDFAATASIVDVIVAKDRGYYEELCLDVEIQPSFSTANYALIAENDAQFSSGGSFSEVAAFATANDAEFVVVSVEGRSAIDSLIVRPGETATIADLEGSTIGVKGKLPPSIEAMLLQNGLAQDDDYSVVLLDGFDPEAHIAIDSIVGFPGYKSNEPGALDRAGVEFDLYDPLDYDIPGSFGVIYTSREFVDDHPTATEDFVRATMRGLDDALTDPQGAADTAVALVNANGNPNFLSAEGEAFRWGIDSALITAGTPDGTGYGVPDVDALQLELDSYGAIGLFGDSEIPNAAALIAADIIATVYDASGVLIWPA